jgi:uncharacterized peroxidase-related enzyme
MSLFQVLSKDEVSSKNKIQFDRMRNSLGKIPNLYTVLANSENALEAYLDLEGMPTSLTNKQVEAVNLAVSEVNKCVYCLSAHTVVAKMSGFTDKQAAELREGKASFDPSLDILVKMARDLTVKRGHIAPALVEEFLKAGYSKENLVDVIMLVGDRTISNLLHAVSKVPVDFPLAPGLSEN